MAANRSSEFGLLAEFANPADLYHACEKVRDAGFRRWDAYTPFPVHGLDHAMGLPESKVPWATLLFGLTGASLAMTMQWWMSAVDYTFVISGKPYFSWQAYVPITFECGILFAALSTFTAMCALNGLPRWNHPLFGSSRFAKVTDDSFFIAIESRDPQYDATRTKELLTSLGALHVEVISDDAR